MLKAALLGNLGSDPELRSSPDGQAFLRMNVASNYRARNQAGEWEDRTEWVRVTVFGRRAERLSQDLRKGSRVYVDGRLEARPWTDRQHQARAGLEVIADDVQFMSPRGDDERMAGEDVSRGGGGELEGGGAGGAANPAQGGAGRAPTSPSDEGDVEDLPF